MINDNIAAIVRDDLCVGCGVCFVSCDKAAIKIVKNDRRGRYQPEINTKKCHLCGDCLRICPGKYVDLKSLSSMYCDAGLTGDILGSVTNCYFSHSNNKSIRYHSSSGGLVTTLLIYALEKGIIDGALVTSMGEENPFEPKSYIALSKDTILSAYGSKYCPTSIGVALNEIKSMKGKFAIVCLPCQMHAVRKLENECPELKDKLVLHLGLFCGHNNTFLAINYFLRKNKIAPYDVKRFIFRDEGWPGELIIELKNGDKRNFLRVRNETSILRKTLFSYTFHRDFYMPRCLLCPDLTCELADISFGDAWNEKFLGVDTIGRSIVITRNKKSEEILSESHNDGCVTLEKIGTSIVKKSQKPQYKENVGVRILLAKCIGKKTPVYCGKKYRFSFIDFLRYARLTPYIMHCRMLWPLWHWFNIPRYLILKVCRYWFGRL